MAINLTDELNAATKKGKIASAKQVYLEGDQENLQQIGDKTHQLEQSIKDISVTGGASTANAVSYNNETSGMTAITAQAAIDELAAKNKSQDVTIATKADASTVNSKNTEQDTEIANKANKSDMDEALAIKFDKENIAQEFGDSEEKALSQKVSSDKIGKLTSEIVRSEISIEETVEDQYVLSTKKIQEDSKYKAFVMNYYPVEPNKLYRVIGTTQGINVAAIALLADKEATEALSVYDVSTSLTDKVNVDRILLIPEGVSYVAFSTKKGNTSKCYVVGEGENRFDELENKLQNVSSELELLGNKFKNKILLAIGDSVTAQKYWQKQVGKMLGMKVRTHATGGIGIIQMVDGDGSGDAPEGYDPDTFGVTNIYKLNTEDVKDVSVIVLMGFYNERTKLSNHGDASDMYPDQNTITGRLNYAIKRVYEELSKASNNSCRVVICSAHKYGKYSYVDKDAYEDGDDLLKYTKMVAEYNSIPCIDLMNNAGINKYNWDLFQNSPFKLNPNYIASDGVNDGTNKPFENKESLPSASENKNKYVTVKGTVGGSYMSDGEKWVLKTVPYPWNADQLHLNPSGGMLLGNYIAAQLLCL